MGSSNGAALAELEAFIRGVESLRTLNEDVAKAAADDVGDVVRSNVEKAITPDGAAWPERKGGGTALSGAEDEIEADAKGSSVVVQLSPPLTFHNWGAGGSSTTKNAERARKRTAAKQASTGVRSKFHAPKRQILPDPNDIPKAIRDVITTHAKRIFRKATGGR